MQPGRKYAFYALAVIFGANFLNYLDRQLVSALEKPVTQSLTLSEAEFGLLWTLFTVGYIASAPFVGFLTDRYRRPRIFAVCIAIWSFATISSGWATTKWVLYVSRALIGVGEAGCLIIGPSLLSEFFDRKVRGRALSTFYLGLPLGGMSGYVVGGLFEKLGIWRGAFLCAGVPGILLAAVMWFLKDPPRGAIEGETEPHKIRGFKPYLELLKTRTLVYIIFAEAFAVMILVPLLHFGKAFFQEARGVGPLEASLILGATALFAGVFGNLLSGWLGDKFSRRMPGSYALIAGICYLLGMPFIIGSFFAGPTWLFVSLLMVGCFFYFMCMPAVNTQIANVTHPNQRAMAYALAVFTLHFLGDMLTPPIFGAVSESLTKKHDPVEVNQVRLVFPGEPPARFLLYYKSYESRQEGQHHGDASENWREVTLPGGGLPGPAHFGGGRDRVFDIQPVRTTRLRFVQQPGCGPPAHPTEARISELQALRDGEVQRSVRVEVDSGEGAARLIDGDLGVLAWASRASPESHFASVIFGRPGYGRRLAFMYFSLTMVLSGFVCFLAARHARRDAAKVMESITQVRPKPESEKKS